MLHSDCILRMSYSDFVHREDMFECLVEGCPKKFKGDFQRERHLIDAHREDPANLIFTEKN